MELLHYIMIASDFVLRKKKKINKKKKNEGIFPLGISSVNVTESAVWPNQQDLVTFTKEIFNGKLHFLCSGGCKDRRSQNPVKGLKDQCSH